MATANAATETAKPVKIALNLIKADHALQPRVAMDDEHWSRMARSYVEGDDVPPPIHLFFDGKSYWLVDGFHRYKAAWSLRHMGAKFTHIKAFVHQGTKREAIVFAAQANLDNRSKPMNDADRKKALFMLMDDPEWRKKSPKFLGKIVGISTSTSRKYWCEFFHVRGFPIPDMSEDSKGRAVPTKQRKTSSNDLPKISRHGSGQHITTLDGKYVYLGTDPFEASKKLQAMMENRDQKFSLYESSSQVVMHLVRRDIHSVPAFGQGCGPDYPSLYGLNVRGIAVTWESFRNMANAAAAIGRAICCRAHLEVERTVVLCPVENGPTKVIELGRKAGVEFMTIEDFVESLKTEPTP
jgi:hypothetical protein